MFKRIAIVLGLLGIIYAGAVGSREFVREAVAQNTTCATRPVSDNSNACASTAFVNAFVAAYTVVCSQFPAGVDCNTQRAVTTTGSLATSDCRKTITLGGSAFYTFTVGAASGFDSTCSVVIVNTDTGRGKTMAINGVTFPNSSILWPGQSFTLKNESNTWTIINRPGRWRLTATTQFEVNSAGSNANDCLGTGASGACQTIQGAIDLAALVVDAAAQLVKIHTDCSGAPTTYTGTIRFKPIVGQNVGNDPSSNLNPILTGDTTTPSNCILTSSSGATVQLVGNTQYNIEGFQLKNTDGSSPCILVDQQSFLRAGVMDYNSCNGASGNHIVVEYLSGFKAAANYTISSGACAHAFTIQQGSFLTGGVQVTLSGTPAFACAFAYASSNSTQQWAGTTFVSSATGTRYTSILAGGIDTNGGGATFLPGNAAGSATNPGWYN